MPVVNVDVKSAFKLKANFTVYKAIYPVFFRNFAAIKS